MVNLLLMVLTPGFILSKQKFIGLLADSGQGGIVGTTIILPDNYEDLNH